jgi:hypothetical protein
VIHADNARHHCDKTRILFWIQIPYAQHLILLIR